MARIRSLLPGVYTDEAWSSVSIPARWLAGGILTEADDNGVFEWKPLQLKMRIYPADNVDIVALLAELEAAGIVRRFEADGKALGALKNFCKYQRPRKPKAWFPLPANLEAFVALGCRAVPQKSEPDDDEPASVPTFGERAKQREDGGGRREEGHTDDTSVIIPLPQNPEPREEDFSPKEICLFVEEHPLLDIPKQLRDLAAWCDDNLITRPNERRTAIIRLLKRKSAEAGGKRAQEPQGTGPPIPIGNGLGATLPRLARRA